MLRTDNYQPSYKEELKIRKPRRKKSFSNSGNRWSALTMKRKLNLMKTL
jgi:hypothetical protein